jgi:hypothetical protein
LPTYRRFSVQKHPYTVVFIVPTGTGAAIGGYAGDAMPVVRAIAQVAERVITHPNVLNGAQLYWNQPNLFYVEGYGLDQFAAGAWGLQPVRRNRVGFILDRAIESDLQLRHIQAAQATRASLGLHISDYTITDAPLEVELQTATSRTSWGNVGNPDSLLRAAQDLIEAGANAIAVVARFPDEDPANATLQQYRQGHGVDALAGAEAIISHLVVRTFRIPCAHAPALYPLPLDPNLSPRAAAEELGYTFFPSVLVGLSRAPQFVISPAEQPNFPPDSIWASQVDAIVVPEGAFGGSAMLSLSQMGIQAIAVEDNQTATNVPPEALGIAATRVRSYLEAVGVLAAHRAGISTEALAPEIPPLCCLSENR